MKINKDTAVSDLPQTSRKGRSLQRSSEKGERLVVGALPFTAEKKILLINSRKHPNEWLFPKGGWEEDEAKQDCATRESWEEAGVLGPLLFVESSATVSQQKECLPLVSDCLVKGKDQNQLHTYYALRIEDLQDEWPERHERERKFFTISEAEDLLLAQTRRKDRFAQTSALESLKKLL